MRRVTACACGAAVLLLAPFALPLNAEIQRCVLADGRVEYRDRACPHDARESTTRDVASQPSALRAAMGPWRCAADPAERTHPVFRSTLPGGIEAVPEVQRTSLKLALQGVALGRCGLHGQGCGDTALSLYRERNGVLFACVDGARPTELRVLPDGRIVMRRGDATEAKVLDPRLPPTNPDSEYRVDLDGNRRSRGDAGQKRLEQLERIDKVEPPP